MSDTGIGKSVAIDGTTSSGLRVWLGRASIQSYIGRALCFFVAVAGAIGFLVPFAWALSTSFKTPAEVFVVPPVWIPRPLQLSNYPEAFSILPFGRFFLNTAIITGICLIGDVVTSVSAAYGFARIRFPGRSVLFMVLLATLMLPSQVTLIPVYMIFSRLDMVDTYYPLVIPAYFGSAFYIFLLRQFFLTIPFDLEDAASIDGASRFRFLANIMVPLSGPAIATVAVFSFMANWQDFFRPLIYLHSRDKMTISLGLRMFQAEYTGWQWEQLMAMTILTTIPSLVLFFAAQRYFISGIVMTGMKG